MSKQAQDNFYKQINKSLLEYYLKEKFKGYDPYDLKGQYFFYNMQKYLGSIGTHITELLNINFPLFLRRFFNISKQKNSKALALFLMGSINLYKSYNDPYYLEIAKDIFDDILTTGYNCNSSLGFGYPFNWYNGNDIYKGTANIVVSSFVGLAFLKLFNINKNVDILNKSNQIAQFITKDLNCYSDQRGVCFSYTPLDNKRVHNANLLAGYFLSELSKHRNYKEQYLPIIKEIFAFSLNDINNDYSFNYYDSKFIQNSFIDNYHTAFVLESLYNINNNENFRKDEVVKKALQYYKNNLFESNIPILSNHQKLPINIHSVASSIICLNKLKSLEDNSVMIKYIIKYVFDKMYDNKNKYFYHRINKLSTIKESKHPFRRKIFNSLVFKNIDKTRYMRWNDAWMFYALSEVL